MREIALWERSSRIWSSAHSRSASCQQPGPCSSPKTVESLVGQEHVEFDVLDQGRYADEVVPLPRQENEAGEIAERIDQRDNLGCQAAARPADRLTMSPPSRRCPADGPG